MESSGVEKPVVLLAGGGTAGHVNPLLALAQNLRQQDWTVEILGTVEGKEKEILPAAGFSYIPIPRLPLPRRPSLDLLLLPGRMRKTVQDLKTLLQEKKIQLVVGFGGYVSTPLYLAAKQCQVPIVIHEQNARPGLANRLGARWAQVVGLTFSNTDLVALGRMKVRRGPNRWSADAKITRSPLAPVTRVIGLPLRENIVRLVRQGNDPAAKKAARQAAAKRLGLDPEAPTLVITGGSLGAQHLNQVMVAAAAGIPAEAQVLHLTGRGKEQEVQAGLQDLSVYRQGRWVVKDYLLEMEDALAVADLMVCRSGAGTVAELAALGIPAIFVPFPIGNGEQRYNAADMLKAGGAKLVLNQDFTADYVLENVWPLLADSERLSQMATAALQCGRSDAVQQLTSLIEEQLKN